MTKYRVDIVDDLMNRVRQHYDNLDQTHDIQAQDGSTRAQPPVSPKAPAHRAIDVSEAYTYNLVAAQYATVEAFGRRRRQRPVVRSSDSAALQQRLPPQTTVGHAGLAPPTRAGARGLPGWARQEMAYEDAISLIEDRGLKAARNQIHSGAVAAMTSQTRYNIAQQPQKPVTDTDSNDADDRYNAPGPQTGPGAIDVTNPNFQYIAGESAFEQYAAGAKVVGGRGVDFFDPDVTATYFGRPARV